MSETRDVQILNDPIYIMLSAWNENLNIMITDLELLYREKKIDSKLAQGVETNIRMTAVSIRSAMKQMRGETP